jgi:pSer/pThr/pTyr-binding forkhead associated (FHA) protein
MNSETSFIRIGRMAAAGAVGGFIAFVFINPAMAAQEEARTTFGATDADHAAALWHILLLGMLLGALIGGALTAVDELQSRNWRRLGLYTLLSAVVGTCCGLLGSIAGQLVFSILLGSASAAGPLSRPIVIVARSFGWALLGAAAGICPGVVARSPRRVAQGIAGGLVGGGVGGLLFDTLADLTQSGSTSRAVGFVLIGALVGALVSLVEEFAKEYWLTALTGAKEGRAFIIARDIMTLGRNELADIPLFGDMSVQRRHARLHKQNGGIVLMAEPGLAVTVNNQPVTGSPLNPGDIIGIGSHRFRFAARRATVNVLVPGTEPLPSSAGTAALPDLGDIIAPPFPPLVATAVTRLEVISGPHIDMVFPLTPGAIVGRDPRCDIPLVQDTQASRQHARLLLGPDGYYIEDGGSTNGLWINGQRVANHLLQPGDQIGIGQTLLRVL